MSISFFLDQCVPQQIINILQDSGYQTLILKNFINITSPDSIVINKAQELDAVLLSLNGDFSDIITYPPNLYGGIIALQLKNHPEVIPQLMKKLINYLKINQVNELGKILIRFALNKRFLLNNN